MREKSVPDDKPPEGKGGTVQRLLKNKWVIYGGIGVLVLGGGYLFLTSQGAAGSGSQFAGIVPGNPVSFGTPDQSLQSPAGVGNIGGGGMDTSGLEAAINALTSQAQANQSTSMAEIQANQNVALQNDAANVQLGDIAGQVANYGASTNVLEAFLRQAPAGTIGLGGSVNPTANGGVNIALFSDSQKQPLAWGDVLHGIANNPNPNNSSNIFTTFQPINIPASNQSPVTGPKEPTVH